MTLYNLRSPDIVTKFDADGNVEASYETSFESCTCPAGHRPTCRHRQMLPYLQPYMDSHWFLNWDGNRQIVDFNGTLKSSYDAVERELTPEPEHIAPAIELHGEDTEARNIVADVTGWPPPRLPAKPWRRV